MVDMRFGHGTWKGILAERQKRIQEAREAALKAKREAIRRQNEIIEKIYKSYFIDGLDIGDITVLINIAKHNNIPEDVFKNFINNKNIENVNSKNLVAKDKDINGVPFFEIGKDFISGAQSSIRLESVIKSNLN